jgi:glycosyltransferase involved in cell wall biosynthesis
MAVSTLIMTRDEEINLEACLTSVAWSDDVIVLDSGSTDGTLAIARRWGCRIFQRTFDDWSSHQNWALRNLDFRHSWVLNVDADERIGSELANEVRAVTKSPDDCVAFRMRRKDYFRDVWLRHATFYPTWLVRLYRPERVKYERLVNPIACVSGKIGALKGHIEHQPFSKGISHWIERHNSYSSFEAQEYLRASQPPVKQVLSRDANLRRKAMKTLFAKMPCRPLIKFGYLYLLHGGFLDGRAGLDYCILQSIYEYLISLKVSERNGIDRTQSLETIL